MGRVSVTNITQFVTASGICGGEGNLLYNNVTKLSYDIYFEILK